jgi:hypothetical protein
VDVCNWVEKVGLAARPSEFGKYPWLCDVHTYAKNHWLLFDVKKLMRPDAKAHFLNATGQAGINTYASDSYKQGSHHIFLLLLNSPLSWTWTFMVSKTFVMAKMH